MLLCIYFSKNTLLTAQLLDLHKKQEKNATEFTKLQIQAAKCKCGGRGGTRPPSTVAWNPNGYCWSHGYKVKIGNTSATCTTPKEGHQVQATR